MTEDLKKVYKWNPADGDYEKNDAYESSVLMEKKLRNQRALNVLAALLIAALLIGSILYFSN